MRTQTDRKTLIFALAGNPNSGKTTLFNNLTGANQHVGNYPGVTVERKTGQVNFADYRITFVDLPGTYSLSAYSIEEIIARNSIIHEKPDVVIDVVDASNIERNLYLTTQLVELGQPVIIVLNMMDISDRRGQKINIEKLSQLLGVPVIPAVASKGRGTDEILRAAISCAQGSLEANPARVDYGGEFEQEISSLTEAISSDLPVVNGYQPRWLALKLLENDAEVSRHIVEMGNSERVVERAKKGGSRIESIYGSTPSEIITDRRYGFISGACSEAIETGGDRRHEISDKIDLAAIHPTIGLIIFAALMWLVFQATFTFGELPMSWIEIGVEKTGALAQSILPDGLVESMIVDGIIAGVGGVIVFLPNIILLFLAIALLEDTGYMARAAFVMDRVMHKIGLHGKSFIPMLIGFGCSVPAYMGSRILEDRTDRLVTMHVITFMSCGARLPVYILICGAFWPAHAGNVVFSLYALGVLVAIGMVKLLRSTRFKGMSAEFIMELPPYRVPTLKSLAIHTWGRAWLYIRKAGTIILAFSIVMWAMMTFPQKTEFAQDYDTLIAQMEAREAAGEIPASEAANRIESYNDARAAEQIEASFAGRIGKAIEPVIEPLGFDWRLGVALVSGFMAKEVVVSTMGTIYGVGDADSESASLRDNLASDPEYSGLKAYAFLVFVLFYMPCMAALAVFLRETGSMKELGYQFFYTTSLAYGFSFLVYQVGSLIGLG